MLANKNSIPELNTQHTESLLLLEKKFLLKRQQIEKWFSSQWELSLPPVYGSVDLRNAGFKLAPIDMNLFPAGFNNLNPNFLLRATSAAKSILQKIAPTANKLLLIAESHTRNVHYWDNVKTLLTIFEQAGYRVRVGILDGLKQSVEIELSSKEKIIIEPLEREHDQLRFGDFIPDLILLNNDLSEGIPDVLHNLKQQVIPPVELGWSQRLKSEHFQYYAEVATEFAGAIEMDSWLISPLFRHCGQIDFMQQAGLDCLISNAEILFAEIQKKYDQYKINYQPFLVIKADAGTYGMAVMTVRNVDELRNLNRKQRTKMAKTKGGQPVNRVIIQEGVYTFETFGMDQAVAEPVVYLLGSCVVGGFYRVHKERGVDENLNAPGMHFEPIAFTQPCNEPSSEMQAGGYQNRLYLYGIVAQLSMLAAAREIKDQSK